MMGMSKKQANKVDTILQDKWPQNLKGLFKFTLCDKAQDLKNVQARMMRVPR